MKPDELLDHLTRPESGGVEALVTAALTRARRRRALRETAAAALILLCAIGGVSLLVKPQSPSIRPAPPLAASPGPAPLTGSELLDAFGDQPVALVTYPDGSQRLLAIVRR